MTRGPRTVLYAAWAPFYSGAERALVVLVEHLDPARYRPVVVLGTDAELATELRARKIEVIHQPIVYRGLRTLPFWLSCVASFASIARRQRAAILHSNDVPSFQPAGYAARLLKVPAVTHVRFPDTNSGFGWFLKPGFARALFVSEDLRGDAIRHAPEVFGERSDVVYDGVQVPPPADEASRMALRHELGLPTDRPLVVMAGQVAAIKGIWEYIEAASIAAGRGAAAMFVVLGDDLKNQGATRIEAEQRVRDRGLTETVRFLGFRPNAQRLMAAFDLVAVPSHVEPLGNATLEAMATARPVVGSRVGGIPEMIVDGETGILVPPKEPVQLADAILSLLADPERARRYGEAGRQRALSTFSVPAHAANVQAIYDRVLHA